MPSTARVRDGAAVLVFAILAWGARASLQPPRADPARSEALLRLHDEILGRRPRPIGSDALSDAREHLARALRARGCAPQVQIGWSCRPGACARVHNVWCRVGPAEGAAVVGLAHLDSVFAGPGAADDGAGVVAWVDALSRLDPAELRRPFVLAITDGEEQGLLGAELLFADPPFPEPIGVVVNLEARGTGGASLFFDAVGPNAFGAIFAGADLRHNGSSAFTAVYDLLPNDTDLSVVRRRGLSGVNHALIGGLPRYHTPLDDRAHLDPDSLAHHADAALAWVRALQDEPPPRAEAFADVLGLAVLRVPLGWMGPLAALAGLGWLGIAVRDRLRRPWAPLAALAGLLAVVAGAEGLGALAGTAWYAHPSAVQLAVTALVVAGILAVARVGTEIERWHAGLVLVGLATGGALAVDARFGIVWVPALLLALAARLAAWRRPALGVLGLAPLVGAATLPYAFGLADALTLEHPGIVAAATYLAAIGLLPMVRVDPRWIAVPAALSLVLAGVARGLPAFTADAPATENWAWRETDDEAVLSSPAHELRPAPVGLAPPAVAWGEETVIRPARRGVLFLQADGPLTVEGVAAEARGGLEIYGAPDEGVRIRGLPPGTGVWEWTSGLPVPVDRAGTVPIHVGDRTWRRAD